MHVIIVEGFDMTGKSVVLELVSNGIEPYRPNYNIYDSWFESRESSFMYGLVQSETFKYLKTVNEPLPSKYVYNRACGSWYVYSRLYDDQKEVPIEYCYNFIDNLIDCDADITFIYVRHKSRESANRIFDYEASSYLGTHTEKYDKFKGFIEYLDTYTKATKLYGEFFKDIENKYSDKVRVIKAYTTSNDKGDLITQVTSKNQELVQLVRTLS